MPPDSRWLYREVGGNSGREASREGSVQRREGQEASIAQARQIPRRVQNPTTSNNLSDLKAQVAANRKGIDLIWALIQEQSLKEVYKYMFAIQEHNAELAVRVPLKEKHTSGAALRAVDYIDDGTPIMLSISIDEETGSAVFKWRVIKRHIGQILSESRIANRLTGPRTGNGPRR